MRRPGPKNAGSEATSRMSRHLYLAAYDITDHRWRAGALKLLRGHATGGQKSVLEVWLTDAEKRQLLADMACLLHHDGDRFLLLRLDPRSRTLLSGRVSAPADPDHFYIG